MSPSDYPNTFFPDGHGVQDGPRRVFDPALKQFPKAFRMGEPRFSAVETDQRWHAARRDVMDHVLSVIAAGPWAERLVLRGSVLMREWFGAAARKPGDIDFVVIPPEIEAHGPQADHLLNSLVAALDRNGVTSTGVKIHTAGVRSDDIWTYERAQGRRLVFPWATEGIPEGTVQLDFVFQDPLPAPPEPVSFSFGELLGASRELSLAWKILWLTSDLYPQGKDLYDAVLLAESVQVPLDLLAPMLTVEHGNDPPQQVLSDWMKHPMSEWRHFTDEYPHIEGTVETWMHRLADALGF